MSKKPTKSHHKGTLNVKINHKNSPAVWVHAVIEGARKQTGRAIEQHLVGAKLERCFGNALASISAVYADDERTTEGEFRIATMVYHVTAVPSPNIMKKCVANLEAGFHPILLIPGVEDNKAQALAKVAGIDQGLTILPIEDFVSFNIISLAAKENKDFFSVLQEIIAIYNKRIAAVETDLSLQIQIS